MKILINVTLILFLLPHVLKSQTARLRIIVRDHVAFDFNTFAKIQNGITYTDYTELDIFFEDSNTEAGWELNARALSATIEPFFGPPGLPLSIIELQATCAPCATAPWPKITLTTADQELASDPWPLPSPPAVPATVSATETIYITYDCNKGAGKVDFSNYNNDTFKVDIEFTLKRKD